MKTCPICRFNNAEGEETCFRCSASLAGGRDPGVARLAGRRGPRPGAWLANRAANAAGAARRRVAAVVNWWGAPPPDTLMIRPPLVSGALSFIPGLGQLCNGQPRKALLFAMGWVLAGTLVARSFFEPISDWICLGAVLWALYAFHDGFKTAAALINRSPWSLRRSFGFYMVWLFDAAALALAAQWGLSMAALRFKHVSQDVFAPVLRAGDRILIDTWTYKFGPPRVGDVVYYDPAQFRVESGMDLFLVDADDDIERVVAGPGQTFERRGSVYYRDGVALPPGEGPLVEGVAMGDFAVAAPAGAYIILPTHIPSELLWSAVSPARAPTYFSVAHNDSWLKACIVPEKKVKGRVFGVYYPPARRRWIRPAAVAPASSGSK